jgi:3-oxochol-4-en-24-oyl-CoA dehydrogenase
LWIAAETARLTNSRAAAHRTGVPGPEGSVAKLQMAELNQAIFELCLQFLGADATLVSTYAMTRPEIAATRGSSDLVKSFLRSRANSIEGGTSEILRNILGERVLGLPPEPRTDKDIPWNAVPRS